MSDFLKVAVEGPIATLTMSRPDKRNAMCDELVDALDAFYSKPPEGVRVVIHEMRPHVGTFAHKTGDCAEMVCSNSFRSDDDVMNAVGQLHWEMRAAGGLIMATADRHRLPAGGALAVDRDPFAEDVTAALKALPNVRVEYGEITELPRDGQWIIATGPLTSSALGQAIAAETGADALAFFDAIAPIVYAESIDMSKAWMQSRYDKGETEEEQAPQGADIGLVAEAVGNLDGAREQSAPGYTAKGQ